MGPLFNFNSIHLATILNPIATPFENSDEFANARLLFFLKKRKKMTWAAWHPLNVVGLHEQNN